jgi:predicted RNA polymerase sigma factor
VQAAIAALHDEAARPEDTDWRQILVLYDLLRTIAPGPMVSLNRIVAVAMVHGPDAGLRELDAAAADPALAGHHRVHAARAHYERAARRTLSQPEQLDRYPPRAPTTTSAATTASAIAAPAVARTQRAVVPDPAGRGAPTSPQPDTPT